MTTRLVLAPSAPSQASEFGACPSVCFQGWKWSLTNTESNPTSSARQEKSNNSRGPNCSADALYPSFNKACSSLPDGSAPHPLASRRGWGALLCLYLRQHILAEAPHIGEHRFGGSAFKIEVDITHAKFAEGPQIGDDIARLSREQPPFPII